ncbi:MAG TPA: N-6 DNA methylase [Gemmatimonadales bacterium]|nr:N-6 DNA methylase [Gemmatimonadales bacterium]
MISGHTLRSIAALNDLPLLVAELGHEPRWEPFDSRVLDLGRRTDPPPEAAIVGCLGGFTWYAVAAADPARLAPRVARRLADRGKVCGVFGLNAESRRLAVSVAFDGAPVLELHLDRPTRLATSCLARLGAAGPGGALATAARTAQALSGAGLGRQFFAAFRATLDRFIAALPRPIPERFRHELALLQLTRVLFLYFVQAKGWLDGSERFLPARVDDCLFRRRRIHRDLLLPLFFGTLNRPVADRRGVASAFGRIPFLNGGLFEPHPLERRYHPDLPDPVWRDAFDTLFERYHFTAGEAGPGSIAPEMLGRVFEGVMEPRARKGSGTYYTPAAVVRTLIDAALAGYIAGRLGLTDDAALARLEAGDQPALDALREISILDPAVGSGAFLLGALERVTAFHTAGGIEPDLRRIVARNLYGVDLNPSAVRIAELRLWLAVIDGERDGSPERVAPLPNLDAVVRQGDSLADPLRLMLRHPVRAPRHATALAAARRAAAEASGDAKREALRLLRRLELDTAAERLDAAIEDRGRRARAILVSARDPTLFGDRRGLDAHTRTALRTVRGELHALRSARRRLRDEEASPAFDFDTHFGDVLSRGGFDLVVGNPPWVRAESLAPSLRHQLRERFHWWRAGAGPGYRHQPDLSVAFLERGWELTRPGGVLAMLLPAKLATAAYGEAARSGLEAQGTVLALADLTDLPDASFDAVTYPLAIVVRAAPAPPGHRMRIELDPRTVERRELPAAPGAPWIARKGDVNQVLGRLARMSTLAGAVHVQLGVKTGANHLFLAPPSDVEPGLIRPALRGRDVRAFHATPSGRIIWTHDSSGEVLPSLPPGASSHFTRHGEALRRRADHTGAAPWMLFRASAGRPVPRVIWPDLASRLEAACLTTDEEGQWVPLNTCYVVLCRLPTMAQSLSAWLNSTWIRAAARATADPASGGYARFNARVVGSVPLPSGVLHDSRFTDLAVRAAGGEAIQEELDALVGDCLNLCARDRRALAEVVGLGAARRR